MARLIEKENVRLHDGGIVFLQTLHSFPTYGGLVSIISLSYWLDANGKENVYSVEMAGAKRHVEYFMDEYGYTWRLWDVNVETPSVQQMSGEPWEVY